LLDDDRPRCCGFAQKGGANGSLKFEEYKWLSRSSLKKTGIAVTVACQEIFAVCAQYHYHTSGYRLLIRYTAWFHISLFELIEIVMTGPEDLDTCRGEDISIGAKSQ